MVTIAHFYQYPPKGNISAAKCPMGKRKLSVNTKSQTVGKKREKLDQAL